MVHRFGFAKLETSSNARFCLTDICFGDALWYNKLPESDVERMGSAVSINWLTHRAIELAVTKEPSTISSTGSKCLVCLMRSTCQKLGIRRRRKDAE
ncbi:hypothetical protein [Argonema antarcticum]|uniref:hypothetical protein n=1 Tax=Argonema antarcticum TaxID=2942763 RepID=UPI0020137BAE|nr:hypothetical protein [Argonema antarcticum]MCL1469749.1 hypothetical protein [Argonema antarcticum A004/B2]